MTKQELEDGLNRLQELAHKTWAKAQCLEDRRKRGLQRLRRFSLLLRVFTYWRFSKLRAIIHRQEMVRSHLVLMAIGMTRKVKLVRRKIRQNEELQNKS